MVIQGMAQDAIVFACANPVPEIWPWEAKAAGARVVTTGRGDFPNQLNNSLVFPGLFRGALDVRARTITDGMPPAVAHELARFARARSIHAEDILPRMDEWDVFPRMAAASDLAAQQEGIVLVSKSGEPLRAEAARTLREAREAVGLLMQEGLIAKPPGS